jgi:SH3 domain protein
MKGIILTLLLLLSPTVIQAEFRYVTDQFKITMRSGESTSHKIMRMLPSGAKLDLLEENAESGYSMVRTQDDEVGYVLSHQLLALPSARERLAAAEIRIQKLQQEPEQLKAKLAQLRDEHRKLQSEHEAILREKNRAEQQLEQIQRTAADAIKISRQRDNLADQVTVLNREVDNLKQKNSTLQDSTRENWFMIGAGVITGGILLGLLLPHLRFRRRKDSWGSL